MAEVIRAGLQSIPKGLLEAAYSSGLTYFQVLTRVILPLALIEVEVHKDGKTTVTPNPVAPARPITSPASGRATLRASKTMCAMG